VHRLQVIMDNLSTTVNFNKSFAKVRLIWVTKLNLNKANSTGTCTIFLLHARHHLEILTQVAIDIVHLFAGPRTNLHVGAANGHLTEILCEKKHTILRGQQVP
jgi:hypothetical protein